MAPKIWTGKKKVGPNQNHIAGQRAIILTHQAEFLLLWARPKMSNLGLHQKRELI